MFSGFCTLLFQQGIQSTHGLGYICVFDTEEKILDEATSLLNPFEIFDIEHECGAEVQIKAFQQLICGDNVYSFRYKSEVILFKDVR